MDSAVAQLAEHMAPRRLQTFEDMTAEAGELERLAVSVPSQILLQRQLCFYERFKELMDGRAWATVADGRAAIKISERQLRYLQTIYNNPELQDIAKKGELTAGTINLYKAEGGGLKDNQARPPPSAPQHRPRFKHGSSENGLTAGALFAQVQPAAPYQYLATHTHAMAPLPAHFQSPAAGPYPPIDATSFSPALPGLAPSRSAILRDSQYLLSERRILDAATCAALLMKYDPKKAIPIRNKTSDDVASAKTSLRFQMPANKRDALVKMALDQVCEHWGIPYATHVHSPLFLMSKPGCEEQFQHTDYPKAFINHAPHEVPSSVMVALEEGTRLVIWDGNEKREIEIPVGHALLFSRFCCHAGAAYTKQNIRLFFETHKYVGGIEECTLA